MDCIILCINKHINVSLGIFSSRTFNGTQFSTRQGYWRLSFYEKYAVVFSDIFFLKIWQSNERHVGGWGRHSKWAITLVRTFLGNIFGLFFRILSLLLFPKYTKRQEEKSRNYKQACLHFATKSQLNVCLCGFCRQMWMSPFFLGHLQLCKACV